MVAALAGTLAIGADVLSPEEFVVRGRHRRDSTTLRPSPSTTARNVRE
jgi:hypothetical protein